MTPTTTTAESSMAPPIATRLWQQTQLKAFQSLYHPFVASLAAGTLAMEDFQEYLLQDAYFLNAFTKAYAFAVTKTSHADHTLALVRLMSGIEHELRTHSAFLQSFGIDLSRVDAVVHPTPAALSYVNFLLATARRSDSVAPILAAMAPCMRLYAFIGQQIAAASATIATANGQAKSTANPYQRWIDSYSSAAFEAAAHVKETLLNETAALEGHSYETLLPLYNQAMELELGFWEQFFPMARAANVFPPQALAFPICINASIMDETLLSCEDLGSSGDQQVINGIDLGIFASLHPGEYTVTVDVDIVDNIQMNQQQQTFSVQISTVEPSVETPSQQQEQQQRVPLFATLLPSSSSQQSDGEGSGDVAIASVHSKAELVVFLKALGARGSFPLYSQPAMQPTRRVPPRVLTIAGSDSGGGAGIQADLKACTNLGVFSTTAITAVTVQNTKGVHGIHAIPVNEISDQIKCVLDDIGTDVVKTGMLFNEEIITMVATLLKARKLPLVVDPVMVSTSGHRLLKDSAHECMVQKLFPLATIITPNIPETSAMLNDRVIESVDDMKRAAQDLAAFGSLFVLVKGGHLKTSATVHDVLLDVHKNEFHIITNAKLATRNTHGTGCTLAAAIAAQYAKTFDMVAAVKSAIAYLHTVLVDSQELMIGTGASGPMLHVL